MAYNDNFNSILVKYAENGSTLCFFGALHSNDTKHPQFDLLSNTWKFFINNSSKNKVVIVESNKKSEQNLKSINNFQEAINLYGEIGAAYCLAHEGNAKVIYPEPNGEEQRRKLCELFDPQDVAYAFIIQSLLIWFRTERKLTLEQSLEKNSIEKETKFSDIYKFTPTTDWFYGRHKKLFGEQKLEDKKFISSISDPRKKDTIINEIVSKRTELRNEYLLKAIEENLKSDKDVFVVYGRGHLDVLKDSLIKL